MNRPTRSLPLRFGSLVPLTLLALGLAGCAAAPRRDAVAPSSSSSIPASRPGPFEFSRDTFAFANETYWVYRPDPVTGRMTHDPRRPAPEFAHRCFVVVRAAKQFRLHARFDPAAPRAEHETYRDAIREIVRRSARRASAEAERVRIPGYPDLRSFSREHEAVLKAEVGPSWESYVQRGHWRMVFPFSRTHQERAAEMLERAVAGGEPVVVHLVRFPALTINHAVLLYRAERQGHRVRFETYDPNEATTPLVLEFDRTTGRFDYPATPYFVGGRVDVYEVFRSFWY